MGHGPNPATSNGHVYSGVHHGHARLLGPLSSILRSGDRFDEFDRAVAPEKLACTDQSLRAGCRSRGERVGHRKTTPRVLYMRYILLRIRRVFPLSVMLRLGLRGVDAYPHDWTPGYYCNIVENSTANSTVLVSTKIVQRAPPPPTALCCRNLRQRRHVLILQTETE